MRTLFLADLAGMTEANIKEMLVKQYEASKEEVARFNILVAYEEEDSCGGDSHFLLREIATGQLFEVHGSHCSCYGFEGQFKPEPTSEKYLRSQHAGWFTSTFEVRQWILANLIVVPAMNG